MNFHGIVMYQKEYRERDMLIKFFYPGSRQADVFLSAVLKSAALK